MPLVLVPLVPLVIVPFPFAAVAGLELKVEAAAPFILLWPYDCIEFTQLAGRIGQLQDLS